MIDRAAEQAVGKKAVREKADLVVLGSVGAPMAGTIIEVAVKTGGEGGKRVTVDQAHAWHGLLASHQPFMLLLPPFTLLIPTLNSTPSPPHLRNPGQRQPAAGDHERNEDGDGGVRPRGRPHHAGGGGEE